MENKLFSKLSVIVFQNDHFLFFFMGCSSNRIAAFDPPFFVGTAAVPLRHSCSLLSQN